MNSKANLLEPNTIKELNEQQKLAKPKLYQVVLLNDDFTTFNFVVYVLVRFFYKKQQEAEELTTEVHETGRGIAGVFSRDEAETKAKMVLGCARENNFPLLCEVEAI